MHKVTKAILAVGGIVLATYVAVRKKTEIEQKEWCPVKTYEGHKPSEELMQLHCPLDYPCVFEEKDDMTCKLTALVCQFDDIRCDVIVNNELHTENGTYTLFSRTANARYITYYNPQSSVVQISKLERR